MAAPSCRVTSTVVASSTVGNGSRTGSRRRRRLPPQRTAAQAPSRACGAKSASAALCRREGLNPNLYDRWSKEFLDAGKKRLVGDTTREATSTDVTDLRSENGRLKHVVAELVLENRLLKKGVTASDSESGT